MTGRMQLEIGTKSWGQRKQQDQPPFNLLVLGNFGGDSARSLEPSTVSFASQRIVEVDLNSANDLWELFSPSLELELGTATVLFAPRSLDDFHPDQLFRNLPLFTQLFETREKLLNPDTAHSALESILSSAVPAGAAAVGPENRSPAPSLDEDSSHLLKRLLGRPAGQKQTVHTVVTTAPGLDGFIHDLVAPHIVRSPDAKIASGIAALDAGISELMRGVLHHEKFQALESNWRGLIDTVTELELGEDLHLYACDMDRDQLLAGLPGPGVALQDCALVRLLVAQRLGAADDPRFAVIAGNYYFGPGAEDIVLLNVLGEAAAMNGGVFLGGANPGMLGCSGSAELVDAKYGSSDCSGNSPWQSLRQSPIASRIGLALPRVLGRLPYGEKTEAIESLRFEEMPVRSHEDYLWKNPAIFCARLLAEQFLRDGWKLEPGDHMSLGNLPAHHYTEDGESRLQPCAEVLLSESSRVAMLNQGIMPLISYRNRNTAMLARFQSIASPPAALDLRFGAPLPSKPRAT